MPMEFLRPFRKEFISIFTYYVYINFNYGTSLLNIKCNRKHYKLYTLKNITGIYYLLLISNKLCQYYCFIYTYMPVNLLNRACMRFYLYLIIEYLHFD